MKIMDFLPTNCKNCYKCVRNCDVKAIRIVNDQAEIIEDNCIGCGKCFVVCPQNAHNIKSDISAIKDAMKMNKKMIVSLAPSYFGVYKYPKKIISSIKALGFQVIEETALGAEIVSDLYKKQIEAQENKKSLITSCCPSVNLLIQRYYPDLLDNLLPVVSPMIAHSMLLKETYGQDSFITFIGPCISKRCEAFGYQEAGDIDAVLSFEELDYWLKDENIITIEQEDGVPDSSASAYGQKYPLEGGILCGIVDTIKENDYKPLSVNGTESCMDLFQCLADDNLDNLFIEANICINGCVGGPAISKDSNNVHLRRLQIRENLNIDKDKQHSRSDEKIFNREFSKRPVLKTLASSEDIKNILKSMGKLDIRDELNCSACGYNTCKDKAQSVFEGMSEPAMCIPFMRSKAEKLSNIIIENTPNIIMILDEDLKIVDMNPACEKAFDIISYTYKDKAIGSLIDDSDFRSVIESKKSIFGKKVVYEKQNLVVNQNILYLPKQNIIMAIFHDLTSLETKNEELSSLKKSTIEAAEKVINKQMRVAQEIASLLGETTAETKITLRKLQEIVIGEEGARK